MTQATTEPEEHTFCVRHGGTYKIVLTGDKAFPFNLYFVSPDLPTDPDLKPTEVKPTRYGRRPFDDVLQAAKDLRELEAFEGERLAESCMSAIEVSQRFEEWKRNRESKVPNAAWANEGEPAGSFVEREMAIMDSGRKQRAKMPAAQITKAHLIEAIARMVDPESFGLPNIIEQGTISDRDEARDKARVILQWFKDGHARAE